MVVHTLHRLPTGSTRPVLTSASPPVLKRALRAWRHILLEPLGTREIYDPLELAVADAVIFSDGAHDLATCVARVPTDSNVSDQVSRGIFLEVEKRGGIWVDQTPPLWTLSGDACQAELDRREQTPESQS